MGSKVRSGNTAGDLIASDVIVSHRCKLGDMVVVAVVIGAVIIATIAIAVTAHLAICLATSDSPRHRITQV